MGFEANEFVILTLATLVVPNLSITNLLVSYVSVGYEFSSNRPNAFLSADFFNVLKMSVIYLRKYTYERKSTLSVYSD